MISLVTYVIYLYVIVLIYTNLRKSLFLSRVSGFDFEFELDMVVHTVTPCRGNRTKRSESSLAT